MAIGTPSDCQTTNTPRNRPVLIARVFRDAADVPHYPFLWPKRAGGLSRSSQTNGMMDPTALDRFRPDRGLRVAIS